MAKDISKQLTVTDPAPLSSDIAIRPELLERENNLHYANSQSSDICQSTRTEIEKLFELGQAFKKNGELEKAVELYQLVLKTDPAHGWANHCLAQTLYWKGDLEDAKNLYLNAAESLTDVNKAISMCQLAEVQISTNNLIAAWRSLRTAETHNECVKNTIDYTSSIQIIAKKIEWLFDSEWYFESVGICIENCDQETLSLEAALHYLQEGYLSGSMPHWILDREYIESQLTRQDPDDIPLALQFVEGLTHGPVITPSWIIDYASIDQTNWKDPLERFQSMLDSDFNTIPACTSVLFDRNYYLKQIADKSENAVKHYVTKGYKLNISTHPAFNVKWYCDKLGLSPDCDAVRHYLFEGGCLYASPNPVFDLEFYLNHFPELDAALNPPLIHFLELSDREDTLPMFDRDYYLNSNSDIKTCGLCPEKHFLEYGSKERHRKPFAGFSSNLIRSKFRSPDNYGLSDVGRYYAESEHRKNSVLVVSHSASRTGAPLIALKIVEELSRLDEIEIFVVVFGDGPLIKEFKKSAHVLMTENPWGGDIVENSRIVKQLVRKKPLIAFCNSSESRHFAKSLQNANILVESLVHEIADHFKDTAEWAKIFDVSEHVVFPSYYVKDRSDQKMLASPDTESNHCSVISQGLLTHNFSRFGVQSARKKTRSSLGLTDAEKIVLGCGTIDFRKGVDLFLASAKKVIADGRSPDVTFIWVGGQQPASDNNNPVYWSLKNLPDNQRDRIIFLSETEDVESWFVAADVFLLSSRSDPYPCVMHEAMAAKLPIVYLQDSGGSAELVNDTHGISVPYEDVDAMSEAIMDLLTDDSKRTSLGESASEYVKEQCRFGDYVANLCQLARDIIRTSDHAVPGDTIEELNGTDLSLVTMPAVYFLTSDWDISGVNSLTEILVQGLNDRGLESRILFTRGRNTENNDRLSFLKSTEVEFLDVDESQPFPQNVQSALLKYFKRHDPCVIVTNYDYTASELSPYLPDHVGIVGVVHSDDSEHYEHTNRLGHYWNRIVAVSERIADRVEEINPGFSARMHCIRNGVTPLHAIEDLINDPRDTRDTVKLVYTGRLSYFQKRVERYAELVESLDRHGVKYEFHFVGDGEAHADMQSLLVPQVNAGKVIFHGNCTVQETHKILLECDIFTLFSDFEGLSMSLLEALSAGCIPLVYDMDSGINHLIDHGKNGFLLSSRSVKEAVPIIEKLQSGTSRSILRVPARELLDQHDLTADALIRQYYDLFNDVLEECESESFYRPRWIHTSVDVH